MDILKDLIKLAEQLDTKGNPEVAHDIDKIVARYTKLIPKPPEKTQE